MVYITYSQQWAKERYNEKIRVLWKEVITAATPDLWIKVLYYSDKVRYWPIYNQSEEEKAHQIFSALEGVFLQHAYPATQCSGNYRCAERYGHGFYRKEWDFIHKHPKIRHCITLKIGESAIDYNIIELMAHEYRHYRQWKKYGAQRMAEKQNGRRSRPVQIEHDAKKWSRKRIRQIDIHF